MHVKPSLLLANESGETSNPGCRAVRRGFDRLFALSQVRRTRTLPLGLWAERFKALAPDNADWQIRSKDRFAGASEAQVPLDIDGWQAIRDDIAANEHWFAEQLREVSGIVVNAEGSMHHNLPRALALAAIIDIAQGMDVPVSLMNATIQGMDGALLQRILPGLGLCQLRENRSLAAVSPPAQNAFVAADIAVMAMRALEPPLRGASERNNRKCIIAGGVLGNKDAIRKLISAARRCGLDPVYLSVGDGKETETVSNLSIKEGFKVIHSGEIELEALLRLLSQAALLISGRHHINIFAMRCGVPIVPLPSNTWKIEATLKLAEYPVDVVTGFDDLDAAIRSVYDDRDAIGAASKDSFAKLADLTRDLPERMRSWIC